MVPSSRCSRKVAVILPGAKIPRDTDAFLHRSAPWADSGLLASFFLVNTSHEAATDISSLPTSRPRRTAGNPQHRLAQRRFLQPIANSTQHSPPKRKLLPKLEQLLSSAIEPYRVPCGGVWPISVGFCVLDRIRHHTLEAKSVTGCGSLNVPSFPFPKQIRGNLEQM